MNNQFDELTKSLAQSGPRRAALKKLGVGLAGMRRSVRLAATEARRFAHPARNLQRATLKPETKNLATRLTFAT